MDMIRRDTEYFNVVAQLHGGATDLCSVWTEEILGREPGNAGALLLRALALGDTNRTLALALTRQACRNAPADCEVWYNLGCIHEHFAEMLPAINAYRRAHRLNSTHLEVLRNGTQLLRINEYFTEAAEWARKLIALAPDESTGYGHLAISLAHSGLPEEADVAYAAAIALADPDAASLLIWEQHFSLLQRHKFTEAWEGYERRFECGRWNGVSDIPFPLPKWTGQKGGHVLLYGEQGIGDQLMFAQAIKDIQLVVDDVSLAVAPWLTTLMANSFPGVTVIPIIDSDHDNQYAGVLKKAAAAHKAVDYTLPLGSLMTHFRNDRSAFSGVPYLSATREAYRRWNNTVAKTSPKRLRIGLCWASNPAPDRFFSARRARSKTMPLAVMAQLTDLIPADFISLTNVALGEFQSGADSALCIIDYADKLTDLNETAALIETLDLVITVDTAVAHLAGAVGTKTWLLLHCGGDARWGLPDDSTSYWYDSTEIFWQATNGDWPELIDRVSQRLRIFDTDEGGQAVVKK